MSGHTTATSPASHSGDNSDKRDFNQLWDAALEGYEDETGKSLRELPLVKDFPPGPRAANQVIEHFEKQKELFKIFRSSGKRVRGVLTPIVDVLLVLKEGSEGASDAILGGDAILGAIGVLLQATRGVSQLYDAVEDLLREVLVYLERLKMHLEPPTPRAALKNILVDMLVRVLMVLAIATKYCNLVIAGVPWYKRLARVLLRRTKDYALVIVDKADVQGLLEELRTLATKEEQVVNAATYADMRETRENAAVVRSDVAAVKSDVGVVKLDVTEVKPKVDYVHNKAVIDDLRSWLDPPNARPTTYDAKKQTNSCAWFFDSQFDDWKARKNGVYWVYGNAGAGKSVLSFSIVEKLQADATLPVVYFHFDFNDTKKQDCRALVSSSVFQLGVLFEDCLAYLKGKRSESPTDPPTYKQLLSMLSHLLSLSGRTFLVIDALDECPEPAREKGLKELLDMLCDLDEDRLRLILTSRPEPDIRECIAPRVTHHLSFHDAAMHLEDLRNHIEARLSDQCLYNWPKGVKATAQRVLIEKSKGMFLWADLQLRSLKSCALPDLERTLNELPSDLNETYERILKNFPTQPTMVNRARHVFECIAFAKRPLSTAEVAAIFCVDFDLIGEPSSTSDAMAHVEDPEPERSILRKCPGLIDVIDLNWPWGPQRVVQFIHFSVQEYLTSSQLEKAPSPACLYRFNEYSAVLTLARICLSALIAVGSLPGFQSYANHYWDDHISSRNDNALGELLFRFLHMGSSSFAHWAQTWQQYTLDDPPYQSYTALHMAAELGLCHHVTKILQTPHGGSATLIEDVARVRGKNEETALHIAARNAQTEIARALLDSTALRAILVPV